MDNLVVDSGMMSHRHTSHHSANHHPTDDCYYHRDLADIGIDCCLIPSMMIASMELVYRFYQ